MSMEEFKKRLGRAVFNADVEALWVDDLLLLQRVFFQDRTWCQPSRLASPKRMKIDIAAGRINREALTRYRAELEQLRAAISRHQETDNPVRRDLHRIAKWVTEQWEGQAMRLPQE